MEKQMRKTTLALATLVAAATLTPSTSHAQYTGPSADPAYKSVADVLKNPVDDKEVLLTGKILRKVSNEKYIFSDGKDEIRVEIDNEILPVTAIDDKTTVEIRGEIEKDFMESPEIDVDTITIKK